MTVLKAILTGEGSCIYRNLLSDDFHKTAVLKKKKKKRIVNLTFIAKDCTNN